MRIRSFCLVVIAAAGVLNACDDNPFLIRWEVNPDTVRLYALSRPEPNLVSGFDFYLRRPVRIEAPDTGDEWDLAVDTRDGQLVWLPAAALGIPSEAGLAILEGETFESATEAPEDTARYVSDAPVAIVQGRIYAIRTRRHQGTFGTICNYYGKIEPLAVDVGAGTVRFQFDVSRVCNSRDLIPPD